MQEKRGRGRWDGGEEGREGRNGGGRGVGRAPRHKDPPHCPCTLGNNLGRGRGERRIGEGSAARCLPRPSPPFPSFLIFSLLYFTSFCFSPFSSLFPFPSYLTYSLFFPFFHSFTYPPLLSFLSLFSLPFSSPLILSLSLPSYPHPFPPVSSIFLPPISFPPFSSPSLSPLRFLSPFPSLFPRSSLSEDPPAALRGRPVSKTW